MPGEGKMPWSHVQEDVGLNPSPAVETIYHAPLLWIKSIKNKIVEKITWHCCMYCNSAKGRVEFENGWLTKSRSIIKEEMKACQITKIQQKINYAK
jgi:hypothetical protein